MIEPIIRLFKAVPIASEKKVKDSHMKEYVKRTSNLLLKETIEKGFVFAPEVIYNYSETELRAMIPKIASEVGLSAKEMNNSFHKSWKKVRDASIFQLVIEQLVHYFTTYGYERLFGTYDKDLVFIPYEELKIPQLKDGISLVLIKGYTKDELKEKLLNFLSQGIALKEDTTKDVVDVALFLEITETEIEQIKNKESKVVLYDYLDKFPENPVEFLRFLVYKSTKKTLLIKNKGTFERIKAEQNVDVLRLFRAYRDKYGLENLAQIFFRYKPLFLAFRTNYGLKPIINRIRKLANTHHVPMEVDYLNDVTAKIKRGEPIEDYKLLNALSRVNTFRKIRLAYALNFRSKDIDSILYKIRNGKSYATSFFFVKQDEALEVLKTVLKSIVEDVAANVKGKKIYIPENVVYALPASEKQFTGDFPSGTCITIPRDMIVGVHWKNVDYHRIDLDLSLINATEGKIGWDSRYRTEDRDVLFSGDMTDASGDGASELFYVKKQEDSSFILNLNYFNYEEKVPVPFKILVAKECPRDFRMNYTVNPNNVICIAKSKIDNKQKILGLLVTSPIETRFYFSESSIGNSITARNNDVTEHSRKYLFAFYTNTISLNEILMLAGAKMVVDKKNADIDLSPETLEKDKIISLLFKKP